MYIVQNMATLQYNHREHKNAPLEFKEVQNIPLNSGFRSFDFIAKAEYATYKIDQWCRSIKL